MHRRDSQLRWTGRGQHAYLNANKRQTEAPYGVADDPDDPADMPSFIEEGRERAAKRHPAQKPWNLCKRLAAWFVEPGALVLDAYAGGGNLGFAALDAGASVILCDTDIEWATHCAERAQRTLEAR